MSSPPPTPHKSTRQSFGFDDEDKIEKRRTEPCQISSGGDSPSNPPEARGRRGTGTSSNHGAADLAQTRDAETRATSLSLASPSPATSVPLPADPLSSSAPSMPAQGPGAPLPLEFGALTLVPSPPLRGPSPSPTPSSERMEHQGRSGGPTAQLASLVLPADHDSLIPLARGFLTPPPTPHGTTRSPASSMDPALAPRSSQYSFPRPSSASSCARASAGPGARPPALPPSSLPRPRRLPRNLSHAFRKSYPAFIEFHIPITHPLRLPAVLLFDSVAWDAGILLLVLLNALTLTFWRPTNAFSSSSQAILLFEIIFQLCFTNEAVVKFIALGLFRHPRSYFRDPWNVFDFFVLIAAWLALYASFSSSVAPPPDTSPDSPNAAPSLHGPLMVFGVLRVLRPFRILNLLPELKRLTGAVYLALPSLTTLMSLTLLVFVTLGVVGLNLLRGTFHQQCYRPRGNYFEFTEASTDGLALCSLKGETGGGRECPANFVCRDAPLGPNLGFTSFDNVWVAFLTIFQCMTQEGWVQVLYWARQSGGRYTTAYFLLIFFLSFFLFNLIIVFVIVNYSLSQERGAIDRLRER
ncbi:voltage-dependent l-type ca channel alpha 1 subunit, partial [Nannochloropsis gaditana]